MLDAEKQHSPIEKAISWDTRDLRFLPYSATHLLCGFRQKGIISLLPNFFHRLYLLAYIFQAQPQLGILAACAKQGTSRSCSLVLGCLHVRSSSTSSLCVWRCLESTLDLYSLFSIHRPLNFGCITSAEFTVASQHQSNKCLGEKRRQFPFICFFLFGKSFSLLIQAFGLEEEQENIASILQVFKSKQTPPLA